MLTRRVAAIGAAALAVGAGLALYGIGRDGNGASATCAASAAAAARLEPLARGEVAAFQVAAAPQDLRDLAFLGPEGEPMRLADFAGKVALVNLWATWCAPCREEMPALDRLQQGLGGDDFAVVAVSVDMAGRDKVAAFLESVQAAHLPLYTDPSIDLFDEFKKRGLALGLPATVLLDRNGCTLGGMNGPAEWDGEDALKLLGAAIAAPAAAAP